MKVKMFVAIVTAFLCGCAASGPPQIDTSVKSSFLIPTEIANDQKPIMLKTIIGSDSLEIGPRLKEALLAKGYKLTDENFKNGYALLITVSKNSYADDLDSRLDGRSAARAVKNDSNINPTSSTMRLAFDKGSEFVGEKAGIIVGNKKYNIHVTYNLELKEIKNGKDVVQNSKKTDIYLKFTGKAKSEDEALIAISEKAEEVIKKFF